MYQEVPKKRGELFNNVMRDKIAESNNEPTFSGISNNVKESLKATSKCNSSGPTEHGAINFSNKKVGNMDGH